ncbi:12767_t:CDS:1, partial [Acaulospora morrowiae]
FMKIVNQLQVKVFYERSGTHTMIIKDLLIGRNYLEDIERPCGISTDTTISTLN